MIKYFFIYFKSMYVRFYLKRKVKFLITFFLVLWEIPHHLTIKYLAYLERFRFDAT